MKFSTSRKIKKTREYRNCYRELKKQVKKHVCRASYTDRKHLKKKNRFDERECINKLHQRHFNEKMTTAKCRKIINESENLSKKSDNLHKYL